jgi:predicted thioesterase
MSAPTTRSWSPDHHAVAERGRLLGATCTIHYDVTGDDSVRRLAGRSIEFLRKPDVVASARLLELCEWPCMDVIGQVIADHECSLGARQELDHRAPIAIGAHLAITARCTVARHPYSEWEVSVHDGHEDVGCATLAFVVVDLAAFEQRHLAPKTAPLCDADERVSPPSPSVPGWSARELNPGSWT